MNSEEYEHELAFAEAYERALNEPATIKTPESTNRANKVADWLSDPGVMLTDLTETLNELLKHCQNVLWDEGNGPEPTLEVIPSHFDEWNLLDFYVQSLFEHNAVLLRIRNSIEPTPFSVDVIQAVNQTFQTYARAYHSDERVSQDSIFTFTNAVTRYQTELEILVDWIEARAIFSGKKLPADRKKKPKANKAEVIRAYLIVLERGENPTKAAVGLVLRDELDGHGYTLASAPLNRILNDIRRSVRQNSDRTAD